MSDEIVSRLLSKRRKIEFLNEDIQPLHEADEDEDDTSADDEYAALNDDSDEGGESELDQEDSDTPEDDIDLPDEEEHDDSQAPIQGTPDMPSPPSHSSMSAPGGEDEAPEEEMPVEEPEPEENPTEYENPLDNQYAVKFTLGDEVSLTSTGTKNSDIRQGTIEGYDPEGFYKVKWSDESTTNGLTDIALEELVKKSNAVHESKCVCGCKEFVEEDSKIVCDRCGRLQESKEDPLMLADKSRPKGKRMIRSEAHPVSTAVKPNIAEAIRNALRGESIREDDDPEEEYDAFSALKDELDNEFWTRKSEMQEDIEDLGYTVDEINDEYVVVSSDEDEDNAYRIPIGGTSRSMILDFSKARMI